MDELCLFGDGTSRLQESDIYSEFPDRRMHSKRLLQILQFCMPELKYKDMNNLVLCHACSEKLRMLQNLLLNCPKPINFEELPQNIESLDHFTNFCKQKFQHKRTYTSDTSSDEDSLPQKRLRQQSLYHRDEQRQQLEEPLYSHSSKRFRKRAKDFKLGTSSCESVFNAPNTESRRKVRPNLSCQQCQLSFPNNIKLQEHLKKMHGAGKKMEIAKNIYKRRLRQK